MSRTGLRAPKPREATRARGRDRAAEDAPGVHSAYALAGMRASGAVPAALALLRSQAGLRTALVAATLLGPCRALVPHDQDPP